MSSLNLSIAIVVIISILALTPTTSTTLSDAFARSYSTFISSKMLGVTYNPRAQDVPSPEFVAQRLVSLKIKSVRLMDPSPRVLHAFAANNISMVLALSNSFIVEFSYGSDFQYDGRQKCIDWLNKTILHLPEELRGWVKVIGVGSDSGPSPYEKLYVVRALRNLHKSLHKAGISNIKVSTSLSTHNILHSIFPPSSAQFSEAEYFIRPLLNFLKEADSMFLVNVYPHMLLTTCQTTVGFAVFAEEKLYHFEDPKSRIPYTNLYDVLIDSVYMSLEKEEMGDLPVMVAETGWPVSYNDEEKNFAEMYVNGLVKHVNARLREIPRRRKTVAGVFLYELFHNIDVKFSPESGYFFWGLMDRNGVLIYDVDFSGALNQTVDVWTWLINFWLKYIYASKVMPYLVGVVYFAIVKSIVVYFWSKLRGHNKYLA